MQLFSEPPPIVQCPKCSRWWKPGNISCAVMHRSGDGCCHYMDTEVPEPYLFSFNPPPPVPVTDDRPIHDADG